MIMDENIKNFFDIFIASLPVQIRGQNQLTNAYFYVFIRKLQKTVHNW